jgi:ABC-type transporter Mla subunit MlaD
MKNMMQNRDSTEKVHEDVDAIKRDLKELTDKLKNLRDDSAVLLSEQLNNFTSVINDLTHKGKQEIRGGLAELFLSTRQHPLRNLISAFAAGVIIALLFRK